MARRNKPEGTPYSERPLTDSDKKLDLHVLIVPSSLWRPDLRFAYNSTCVESISAGFVRVHPDASLHCLRNEISQQLESKLLPSSYTFLRSIGKCLTSVTYKQEGVLKTRLFLPPLAPCPEIYVLDSACLEDMPLHHKKSKMYMDMYCYKQSSVSDSPYSQYSHPHQCTPPFLPTSVPHHLHYTPVATSHQYPPFSYTYPPAHAHHLHSDMSTPLHNNMTVSPIIHPDPHATPATKNLHHDVHTGYYPPTTTIHPLQTGCTSDSTPTWQSSRNKNSHQMQLDSAKIEQQQFLSKQRLFQNQCNESPLSSHVTQNDRNWRSPSTELRQPVGNVSDFQLQQLNNMNALQSGNVRGIRGNKRGHQNTTTYPMSSASPCQKVTDSRMTQLSSANLCQDVYTASEEDESPCRRQNITVEVNADDPEVLENTVLLERILYGSCEANRREDKIDTLSSYRESGPISSLDGDRNSEDGNRVGMDCPTVDGNKQGSDVREEHSIQVRGENELHQPALTTNKLRQPDHNSRNQSNNGVDKVSKTKVKLNSKGDGRKRFATHPPVTNPKLSKRVSKSRKIFDKKQPLINTLSKSNVIPKNATSSISGSDDLRTHLQKPVGEEQLRNKGPRKSNEFSVHPTLPPIKNEVQSRNRRLGNMGATGAGATTVERPSTAQKNQILAELRRIKQDCEGLSVTKAEMSSNLRYMQHSLKSQRENSEKEWKRRYFQEKKYFSSIEEQINKAKKEMQQLQNHIDRKRGAHIRSTIHSESPSSNTAPSEHSNVLIQCKRNEINLQSLRSRLEEAKQRLSAERTSRKNVNRECKILRKERLEKKMACTRIKAHTISTKN